VNKKTVLRNILVALMLVVLSAGATLSALFYIQFFMRLPR
jgi:hypothetical protein